MASSIDLHAFVAASAKAFQAVQASPTLDTFLAQPDGFQILAAVAASAIGHTAVYLFTPASLFVTSDASPKDLKLARSLSVSCAHALSALALVAWWLSVFGSTVDIWSPQQMMAVNPAPPGFAWMKLVLANSLGYFLYDTICMMFVSGGSTGDYIHHAIVSMSILLGLVFRVAQPYHFLFLLEEFSTPFLNWKTLLKNIPGMHTICSLAFLLSFVFARNICGSYLFYSGAINGWAHAQQQWKVGDNLGANLALYQVFACGASRVLNAYWAVIIIKKAIATCFPSKKQIANHKKGN